MDLDPQSLAAASLRNPTDALNLLALAADVDRASKHKGKGGKSKSKRRADGVPVEEDDGSAEEDDIDCTPPVAGTCRSTDSDCLSPKGAPPQRNPHHHRNHHPPSPPSLASYELIKQRVLSTMELTRLTSLFYSRVHVVFPMMPYHRIPRTEAELSRFAKEDTYLLTAIVVITSRQERMFGVHERSWNYMQVSTS